MPAWRPVRRRELIAALRRLGFQGPYSGGKHEFMVRGQRVLPPRIPVAPRPPRPPRPRRAHPRPLPREGGPRRRRAGPPHHAVARREDRRALLASHSPVGNRRAPAADPAAGRRRSWRRSRDSGRQLPPKARRRSPKRSHTRPLGTGACSTSSSGSSTKSYFPLSEPPTLRLRRRVLRPRRRPSGCPSHTTAASGCMTSTGESAKPRGSRVTMALQPAASAAAAQTASSKSRHPRVNARLITAWSTGATRNTVSRSPTTRRA